MIVFLCVIYSCLYIDMSTVSAALPRADMPCSDSDPCEYVVQDVSVCMQESWEQDIGSDAKKTKWGPGSTTSL